MLNAKVIKILNNIADILDIQEVKFKPQAYRIAARSIENLSESIETIYEQGKLENIPGVGEHIAKKIEEIILTKKLKYYEKLKKEIKIDIESLHSIPGLGPKKIKVLFQQLKVKNIKDLKLAIKEKKFRTLPGFAEKTEKHLLNSIKLLKKTSKKWPYQQAKPIVEQVLKYFKRLKFVQKIEVAGSFRRKKSMVGDLDFLIITNEPKKAIEFFISLPRIKEIINKGATKSSIRLKNGLQIDLRVFKEEEFGAASLYFIGDKTFNIKLRKLALSKGYTLNEYGLYDLKTKKRIAGKSETQIFKILGMKYIPPEKREITKE